MMNLTDPIKDYLRLTQSRPDLFVPSEDIPIILDEVAIRAFATKTGKPMGIVLDNSPYFLVLSDLCGFENPYAYVRVVYPNASSGSVAIPHSNGRYGLLEIFRHAPRKLCLEFPRGFAEGNLTPEENIIKELGEEMQISVTALHHIGKVHPDTGLSAGCADVYLAEITADMDPTLNGYEGIRKIMWLTESELNIRIQNGDITDGFTLAALTLARTHLDIS